MNMKPTTLAENLHGVTFRLTPELAAFFAKQWRGEMIADLESPPSIDCKADLEAFLDLLTERADVLDVINWGDIEEVTEVMVPRKLAESFLLDLLMGDIGASPIGRDRLAEYQAGYELLDQTDINLEAVTA